MRLTLNPITEIDILTESNQTFFPPVHTNQITKGILEHKHTHTLYIHTQEFRYFYNKIFFCNRVNSLVIVVVNFVVVINNIVIIIFFFIIIIFSTIINCAM